MKPGGVLVYAVCSVLIDECENVARAFLEKNPKFVFAPFSSEIVRKIAGDAPTLRLLPSIHGTEGYFLASFRRLAE